MDKNKIIEQLKPLTPALAAVVVAGCVVSSLSGYQAPVYASDGKDTEENAETLVDTGDKNGTKTSKAKGSFDLADGTYQGSGTGYAGTVTVAVKIKDKSIVSIDVLSTSDDDAFFSRAKGVIDKIIQTQKIDVDVVSGATYSSNGIISAVRNALTGQKDSGETGASQSGNTAVAGSSKTVETVKDADGYKDGTYYGSGTGFGGPLTVKVVISNGKIASIEITETSDGDSYVQKASGLISNILASQSTNVDTVSGATYSSVGIIEAVRDALSQAAVTQSSDQKKDDQKNNNQNHNTDNPSDKNDKPGKTGAFPYNDGIYYGTAEGYKGDITVAVVLQDHTIQSILVTEKNDDDQFFNRAMKVVTNVVKKQDTNVDTVSGATYSSKGLRAAIKNALKDAKRITEGKKPLNDKNGSGQKDDNNKNDDNKETLDITELDKFIEKAEKLKEEDYTEQSWALLQEKLQEAKRLKETLTSKNQQGTIDKASATLDAAISGLVPKGEEEPETAYINGDYTVTVECTQRGMFDYEVTLTASILNDKIVSVSDITWTDEDNDFYMNKAVNGNYKYKSVVSQIVEKGMPDQIDAVSGATYSSNAIVEACRQALEKAKR